MDLLCCFVNVHKITIVSPKACLRLPGFPTLSQTHIGELLKWIVKTSFEKGRNKKEIGLKLTSWSTCICVCLCVIRNYHWHILHFHFAISSVTLHSGVCTGLMVRQEGRWTNSFGTIYIPSLYYLRTLSSPWWSCCFGWETAVPTQCGQIWRCGAPLTTDLFVLVWL